jgi:hypothetical protein
MSKLTDKRSVAFPLLDEWVIFDKKISKIFVTLDKAHSTF